jgi:hypothetical protein
MGYKRADDEIRTRDIHLGKVVLYQLSYVRILQVVPDIPVVLPASFLAEWAILGSNQ